MSKLVRVLLVSRFCPKVVSLHFKSEARREGDMSPCCAGLLKSIKVVLSSPLPRTFTKPTDLTPTEPMTSGTIGGDFSVEALSEAYISAVRLDLPPSEMGPGCHGSSKDRVCRRVKGSVVF